ncbi:MAG: phage integrase SAM-like domain-containing protein [Melioribacteraceae bacterium]|nr:phage integrase SAM-like domain-containing protein [Melioribacteraceae bacterium]MCF8265242.1 phage integrase SAM-like domain-containing protein [Melioribacteraceae bacterium]MCF8413009.1 phage integrase SAM-like domain-containing protein [Melioribacteraceae bacterium]
MFLTKTNRSPFYQFYYFKDGKRTSISTKTESLKIAEEFVKKFMHELNTEQNSPTIPLNSNNSLKNFSNEYENYLRPTKSKSYLKSIGLSFRQLESFLGNKNLEEITLRELDQFITVTYARTQRGAYLYYRTLKAAFSKAVDWEYLQVNHFKKIRFPRLN